MNTPKAFSVQRSVTQNNRLFSKQNFTWRYCCFLFTCVYCLGIGTGIAQTAVSEKAMVVTAHPKATEAALNILKEGGNAADALVAAQWMLNVVEPQSSGIGGGGFILYYDSGMKTVTSFDGREIAPKGAYPEMFLTPEKTPLSFDPERITGGLPVGVPGTLKLMKEIHSRFSSLHFSFEELFDPAIQVAEEGFEVGDALAQDIRDELHRLSYFEATKNIFSDENGRPVQEGSILKLPDLAKTFRLIQKEGVDVFYEGEIAKAIEKIVRENSFSRGFLTRQDLKDYAVYELPPVHGTYREYDLFSMGLPSSGGITLVRALNILEALPLSSHGRGAAGLHYLNEAQKIAFRDRTLFLGDLQEAEKDIAVLLDKENAKEWAQKIPSDDVLTLPRPQSESELPSHTTHISIIDRWGNAAVMTSTIEQPFGSAMVVPGYGFLLNNELSDFDPEPYDGSGSLKPNAPASGKKPLSSMAPTLVFKQGDPAMALGSPGGTTIIGTVLNILVNRIDFGLSCEQAVYRPRVINRWGATEAEAALDDEDSLFAFQLDLWGHILEKKASIGNAQVICRDHVRGDLTGVSDPRGEGKAAGL